MSGMIGDVVEYTHAQEDHLVLLRAVKSLRKVVDELTRGDAITARDSAVALLSTLESRLDFLDERRNRPKETP